MLPKKERLTREDFNSVFKGSRTFKGRFVSLRLAKKTNGASRFAVVVSKKTVPLAVDRNLLRRRIYGILRELRPKLVAKGYFVFTCLPGSPKLKFLELKEEILTLIKISKSI